MARVPTPARPPSGPRRRPWRGPLVGLVSLAASLATVEFGFRWLAPRYGVDRRAIAVAREVLTEGRASQYRPQPYYGWSLSPASRGQNRYGFYGDDWPVERRPGVLRVVCLGGSTTAGGNPKGPAGAYPHFLRAELERRVGGEVEVLNCGISGWTTAEMVCAWFLLVQDFRPDLVVLHEVVNDVEPRLAPGFAPDYTHWRTVWRLAPPPAPLRWLAARSDLAAWSLARGGPPTLTDATVRPWSGPAVFADGRLLPETGAAFRRNVLSIAASQRAAGGAVLLATLPPRPWVEGTPRDAETRAGIAEHNQLFRDLAREHGFLLADLERLAAVAPAIAGDHYLDLVHVDPEGNALKAAAIARVLAAEWEPLRPRAPGG